MSFVRVILACLALTACTATVPDGTVQTLDPGDYLPAGYPPKIGDVVADLNGATQHWDTYDYSIGAFDAAVQIVNFNGEPQFRLMGEPAGKPNSDSNRLVMKAVLTSQMQTGALTGVLIEIIAGKDWNGLRLSSTGGTAEVVLDTLVANPDRPTVGHVKGHFSAVLCVSTGQPAVVDRSKCQTLKGTFASDLQFDGF